MSKISFKETMDKEKSDSVNQNHQESAAGSVEENQAAEFDPNSGEPGRGTAVAERSEITPAAFNDEEDDVRMDEVVFPLLNIVQKSGELSDKFAFGDVILDLSVVLPQPVEILVLGFAPLRYVEKVDGGGRGMIVDSESAVVEMGGTTDWNESKKLRKPLFQRLATALILVKQPEGTEASRFPFDHDGTRYALAKWNMKASAYNSAAKRIKSAKKIGHLRGVGYRGGWWKISTEEKRNDAGKPYMIPVLEAGEFTTPEFRKWIAEGIIS